MLLGAALIVRNEERCLARCLASITPIVDEIVLVDTGSTDATVSIAEDFGARVFHRPWDGDFSAARNFGLDRVQADLVLYIDADEYVVEVPRDFRAQLERRASHVAFRPLLRHRPGWTPLREYRIWENRPGIRFDGVIHETHVPSIQQVCLVEGRTVGEIDLLLEHDGYEAEAKQGQGKADRDVPLLEEQIRQDPGRTYLWDQLGRIRDEQGDIPAAREAFLGGIQQIRAAGVVRDSSDSLVYSDLIYLNAVNAIPDAALVEEALGWFPRNPLVLWAATLDSFQRKAYGETEEYATRLLSVTEEEMAADSVGINRAIQPEWAPHIRGMARFESGDFAGAAEDFRAAEQSAPDNPAYRVKRMLAEARSGKSPR